MAVPSKSSVLGFDAPATRDAQVSWLLANGRLPEDEVQPAPDSSLPDEEREYARWMWARDVAMIHANLHAVPSKIRGPDGVWHAQPRCREPQCQIAAVSFALLELVEWCTAEEAKEFASELEKLATHLASFDLGKLGRLARATLGDLDEKDAALSELAMATAASMEARGEHEAAAALGTVGRGSSYAPRLRARLEQTMDLIVACRKAAELSTSLAQGAGADLPLSAKQGQQSRGGGPKKQALLTAELQHLRNGDVPYAELDELVVGMPKGRFEAPPETKNRLHQRVRGEDLRSIVPFEENQAPPVAPVNDPTDVV